MQLDLECLEMEKQDVKPVVLVLRHVHADAITAKLEMHALVLDVSNAIKTQSGISFPKENRPDGDAGVLRLGVVQWQVDLAHIVDQTRNGEHVERAECAFLHDKGIKTGGKCL